MTPEPLSAWNYAELINENKRLRGKLYASNSLSARKRYGERMREINYAIHRKYPNGNPESGE